MGAKHQDGCDKGRPDSDSACIVGMKGGEDGGVEAIQSKRPHRRPLFRHRTYFKTD